MITKSLPQLHFSLLLSRQGSEGCLSIHFVAGSEFVELPRPEHNFIWQSSIQIFIYVFWHLLPAGMLKYLSWEGGNREKERNAIPNDLYVIQYLFLIGWKALKKEELWTGSWENLVLVLVSEWRDWTWGSNSVFWALRFSQSKMKLQL